MTIRISFSEKTVRVAVEINGAIESAITELPQRTWVGLKRDEQSFVYSSLHNATSRKDSFWVDFANAIEAELRSKNT